MKLLAFVFGWIWLITGLTGCAHRPPKVPTGLRPQSFWADQKFRRVFLTKLNGKLSMRYTGKSERVSGKGLVVSELPERTRLELRDPLGRVRYLAALSGASLTVFYPSEKIAYLDGEAGTRYLKKFLGVELPFENLVELFVGILPERFHPKALDNWDWDASLGAYVGTGRSSGGRVTVAVDPDLAILRRLTLEISGETLVVDYADPEPCCENSKKKEKLPIQLAAVVTVTQSRTKNAMEVEWDKLRVFEDPYNTDVFRLVLPEDVKKVPLN